MTYLEEWGLVDQDYCSSLSGATEALKASTLRLPVVAGAKVSISISAAKKVVIILAIKISFGSFVSTG
jgi:hypothetical protein